MNKKTKYLPLLSPVPEVQRQDFRGVLSGCFLSHLPTAFPLNPDPVCCGLYAFGCQINVFCLGLPLQFSPWWTLVHLLIPRSTITFTPLVSYSLLPLCFLCTWNTALFLCLLVSIAARLSAPGVLPFAVCRHSRGVGNLLTVKIPGPLPWRFVFSRSRTAHVLKGTWAILLLVVHGPQRPEGGQWHVFCMFWLVPCIWTASECPASPTLACTMRFPLSYPSRSVSTSSMVLLRLRALPIETDMCCARREVGVAYESLQGREDTSDWTLWIPRF